MIHLAPVGATRHLVNSIDWSYGDPPPQSRISSGVKTKEGQNKGTLRISIYAGNDLAYYARWVEFGTSGAKLGDRVINASGRKRKAGRTHPGSKAQPFFFPAYRTYRKKAANQIKSAVRKAIKKVANDQTGGG